MNMKKKLHVFAVFMLACFAVCLTACDKDDDKDNGNGTGGYHMTAKIDGRSWASAPDQLILVDNKNGYLFISGALNENDDEVMTIQIFDFPGGTGIYPLGTGEYDDICFYVSPDEITYYVFADEPDAYGVLEITAYESNYIAGTFSFTATDVNGEEIIEVTEGSFRMRLYPMPK